jgi:hypothetical protein
VRRATVLFSCALALGCREPAATTPPRAPATATATAPDPAAPDPATPDPPPLAPIPPAARVASPERGAFEMHVPDAPELATDPDARAWLELARTAFGNVEEGGFRLRATPREFYGLDLVLLEVFADPDGRSGHSRHPTAFVHFDDGWWFVHPIVETPPELPVQPVQPPADAHVRIGVCDREGNAAVVAATPVERGHVAADRCAAVDAVVASVLLQRAQGASLESEVRIFVQQLVALASPTEGGRVAMRASDVRDARWRDGGRYVPWQAARDGDTITASGTVSQGRSWYRFALRVGAGTISLELALLGRADSHGVPP